MRDDPNTSKPMADIDTMPPAVGGVGGLPVEHPDTDTVMSRPPTDDRDPAEAEFERLTGHKTDERPSGSGHEGDRDR
jgi:hypothetical protein